MNDLYNVELMMDNTYLSITENKTFSLNTPYLVVTQKEVLEIMFKWFKSKDEYYKSDYLLYLMNNKKIEYIPLTNLDLDIFNHQINMYQILKDHNLL